MSRRLTWSLAFGVAISLAALIASHNYALAAEMDRTVTIEDGAIVPARPG